MTDRVRSRLECRDQGGKYRKQQCVLPGQEPVEPECKGNKVAYLMPNGRYKCISERAYDRRECKAEGGKFKKGDCVFPVPDIDYLPPPITYPDPDPGPTPGDEFDTQAAADFRIGCEEIGGAFSMFGSPITMICRHGGQTYYDINDLPDPQQQVDDFPDLTPEEECSYAGGVWDAIVKLCKDPFGDQPPPDKPPGYDDPGYWSGGGGGAIGPVPEFGPPF